MYISVCVCMCVCVLKAFPCILVWACLKLKFCFISVFENAFKLIFLLFYLFAFLLIGENPLLNSPRGCRFEIDTPVRYNLDVNSSFISSQEISSSDKAS